MNAIEWFEIPAVDFDRAVQFYENLLQVTLRREMFGGTMPNAVFPYQDGVGGAVAFMPHAQPGANGAVIYLHVNTTTVFDAALACVEQLGGKLVMPKTDIGANGFIALILDTEGNRVGLHVAVGA